jgi:hypothetical protein
MFVTDIALFGNAETTLFKLMLEPVYLNVDWYLMNRILPHLMTAMILQSWTNYIFLYPNFTMKPSHLHLLHGNVLSTESPAN